MTRKQLAVAGAAALCVFAAAIVLGAHMLSLSGVKDPVRTPLASTTPTTPAPGPSPGATATTPPPAQATNPLAGFDTYRDKVTGLSISYPSTWTTLKAPPTGIDLLAGQGNASLLVRVTRVGINNVTPKTLPLVRPLLNTMVQADQRVTMLSPPQAVEVGGLLGYRYRYTFRDTPHKTLGAHVHYFLIKNGRIIQLTFQALPSAQLKSLDPTFAIIAGTFKGTA